MTLTQPSFSRTVARGLTALLACALALTTALAQTLPVTTASPVAMAHYTLAKHAGANANIAEARMHIEKALVADPGFAQGLVFRGNVGTAEENESFGARAVAAGKKLSADEQAYVQAMSTGDFAKQVAGLRPLVAKYPKDAWLGFLYGFSLNRSGDLAGARAAFEQVLAYEPTHPGALNILGYTAFAMGDNAAAEKAFRAYIAAHPDEANPYDSMGEMLMLAGRYDEAAKYFKQALERNPEMKASTANLAQIEVMKQLRRYEKASMAGDAKTVASLYSKNAQVFPNASAPVMGREAIEAYQRDNYAKRKGKSVVAFTTTDFHLIDATTAIEMGSTVETHDGVAGAGNYFSHWALIDGEWLLTRDMWTEYTPEPVAVASK